jgi:2-methylaconitate cis-trans-isomerase PrpF
MLAGQTVPPDAADLLVRLLGGRPLSLHKAFAATAAAATAVAAAIPGTVAYEAARRRAAGEVVLGHPSGTFPVRVRVSGERGNWTVERASYSRTARRLMEGYAFVRASLLGV